MLPLPHRYVVEASIAADDVDLTADGVSAVLPTAAPPEFDGPGDRWSPETLLVGAIADCFAITFRGVARRSKLPWTAFGCRVVGTLDRVDGAMRFTCVDIHADVTVAPGASPRLAHRVLENVERNCLITNSLNASVFLHPRVRSEVAESEGAARQETWDTAALQER